MGSKSKIKIGKAEAQAFAATLKDVANISQAWYSELDGALRYAHATARRHKKAYTQEKLFAVARANLFSLLRRRGVKVDAAQAPKHQELGAGASGHGTSDSKGAGCGAGCKCMPTPVVHFAVGLSLAVCNAGVGVDRSDDVNKVTCVDCLRRLVNQIDDARNSGDSIILSLKKQLDAEKNRANVLEHDLLNVRVALLRTTEAHEATALALNAART